MNPASCDESLESEIRTLLRLRLKHPARSPEAQSYRQAVRDRAARLKALRLAQSANRDSILPPLRKKHFYRGGSSSRPHDSEPSSS